MTTFWICVAGVEFLMIIGLGTMAANRIQEANDRAAELQDEVDSLREQRSRR
jgi:hypothetical protein